MARSDSHPEGIRLSLEQRILITDHLHSGLLVLHCSADLGSPVLQSIHLLLDAEVDKLIPANPTLAHPLSHDDGGYITC